MQLSKTQIFGYLWHLFLFSNAFFKTQMWQKAEEYVPKQVCQHSSAQAIVTGKIRRVMYVNFECVLANQMYAFKTNILGTLKPCFYFLNGFSKALIWHKAEEYVLKWFGSIALHKSLLETKKIYRVFYLEFSI